MKSRVYVLSAAIGAAIVAGGCTKIQTSTAPGAAHSWTTPGVLRISDISDPSTLNPMLTGADIAYQLASYTLEYLVQLDENGNLLPVLCTAVPTAENGGVSKDGLTVTYHLRRGVNWSDGVPFTSEDVIASWKQVMNPLNNVNIRVGYDVVDHIDAPDKFTVVVHLKHPYAPFPTRFFVAIQEGPIAVMPAHIIGQLKDVNKAPFGTKPIGTGPFVVESWVHNGPLTFVANPHYWRGGPKLKKIIFHAEPSTSTELIGFQTHEIDADLDAGGQRILEFKKIQTMRTLPSRALRLAVLSMFAGAPPLDDVRVRHAVAYAVDRNAILHKVIHDAGYLADEYLPTWSWAYTPDVPRYNYDPAKAAALLDEVGWKIGPDGYRYSKGVRLSLTFVAITGSGTGHQVSQMVQASLRALGVEVVIKNYPYGIVFDIAGPIRQGKFNLTFYSYSVNYDPEALKDDGCTEFSPSGANESRFCDPIVDREEREALAINETAKRKKLYADIERRRMENLTGLPLYFPDRVGVMNEDLRGYTPSRGIIPEWNAWQWSLP